MADEETPAPTDEVDVTTREQTLPTLELPEYHGRSPVGMKTSLNGAGNRVTREHSIGDRVVLVIEAKVKKAGHEETDDGLIYAEVLKVIDLFEIQGDPGRRLISAVRQSYRTADDEANGREPLPDLGAAGITDASGVALTPAELGELRGDPVRAMLDDSKTPVVVVYSDGARELWPDDFGADAPRPNPGERFEAADDVEVHVREILHGETGETLEVWTDEQEDAYLLELEERLAAEERAEEAEEELDEGDDLDAAAEKAFEEAPLPGEDEVPDNVTPIGTPGAELAAELNEPDDDDFAFVDRKIDELEEALVPVGDEKRLERLLEAEKRGRGRGLKPRAGALSAIEARLSDAEKAASMIDRPEEDF